MATTPVLIYRFTNKTNGKVYIGKTAYTLAHRKGQHVSEAKLGCKRPFHAALRKYGIAGFYVEVIDKADDKISGDFKEKLHIILNDCKVPKGYNLTDGGEGAVGRVFSEEHRKRLSNALKGRRWSYERRIAASALRRGRKRSPCTLSTKQKISSALKGRPHSAERIRNIKEALQRRAQCQLTQIQ